MRNTGRFLLPNDGQLRSKMAFALIFTALVLSASGASRTAFAQDPVQVGAGNSIAAVPVVPQQVRYAGKLASRPGDTVEAMFRIYAVAEGDDPLWTETQQVTVAEDGSYSVLLGGASPTGLPQTVFAGGAARWLGISVDQSPEQERVLLSSVPYAMKSADAESLSGHAVTDFVTQSQLAQFAQARTASSQAANSSPVKTEANPGTVTGSGTSGTVPLWTGTLTQGNSEIYQVGSDIGINETVPIATLDVNGTANVRGTLNLPPVVTANSTNGERSQEIQLSSSVWSSTASAPVAPTFKLLTYPLNNNTANATGDLEFYFQQGTTSTKVLSIANNGVITFSPSQTFPGTTNKTVSATSPITATTTASAINLGLNTTALETSLNSVYPQLGTYNTFAGGADFGNTVSAVTVAEYGFYADNLEYGYGGYFVNNTTEATAVYAENDAAGSPGLGIAVKGYVPSASSIGVLGKSEGDDSYGVFGEDIGGTDSYGVYANATGTGSIAVYGVSTGGPDANGLPAKGVVGVSTSGNGVEGSTQGASATGAGLEPNGSWGMWGDIGTGSAVQGAAILGTADNYTGAWLRNNGGSPTLVADNEGAGQAAVFYGGTTWQYSPTVTSQNTSTGGAGEFDNNSTQAVTLYLSNEGGGPVTDQAAKTTAAATDPLFKTLMASTPTGTCGFGGNGDLSCTGQVKSLVSTGGGARKVETYAPQSAENWMEDYGTGVMEHGVALIKIDAAFAETISESADYHVFLTPNADAEALYVINKTATSFEVRESKGGTSTLTFDYKIVAKRRGYETQRLKDVTEDFNEAQARVALSHKPDRVPAVKTLRPNAPAHSPGAPKSVQAALAAPEHKLPPIHPSVSSK